MPLVRFGPAAGNLAGQVVDYDNTPVADADVSLICGENRVCTKIRTDSMGEFVFEGVPSGKYGLLVGRSFVYPWFERSLEVRQGQELMYQPISLQRCPEKYCDPARRPKPVLTGQITLCQ
jgi:Carboxypeptidase regulatory-like domain